MILVMFLILPMHPMRLSSNLLLFPGLQKLNKPLSTNYITYPMETGLSFLEKLSALHALLELLISGNLSMEILHIFE